LRDEEEAKNNAQDLGDAPINRGFPASEIAYKGVAAKKDGRDDRNRKLIGGSPPVSDLRENAAARERNISKPGPWAVVENLARKER
jgi:hypothetical protein